MAPSRRTVSNDDINETQTAKKAKRVMTLNEKVQLLDKCREGLSNAAIGRLFGVNESTVRYMRGQESEIREAVSTGGSHTAKYAAHIRDKVMLKMEKALFAWIEEQHKKNLPVSRPMISAQALLLYDKFKQQNPSTSTEGNFTASKGWFQKFKQRFSLRNVANESAFTDYKAANADPIQFTKEEGNESGYVFNADDTMLFGKKMPQRTFIATKDFTDQQETSANELVNSNSEDERAAEVKTHQKGEKSKLSLENLTQAMHDAKHLADFFLEFDDNRIRAMQFNERLNDILTPYTAMLDEFEKSDKQPPIAEKEKFNIPDTK